MPKEPHTVVFAVWDPGANWRATGSLGAWRFFRREKDALAHSDSTGGQVMAWVHWGPKADALAFFLNVTETDWPKDDSWGREIVREGLLP